MRKQNQGRGTRRRNFTVGVIFVVLVSGLARALECPKPVESDPADLVQFLEAQARTADPECVTLAIRRLGEFRSPLGIAVLVDLLDFRRPDSDAEKLHVFDAHDKFPAVSALFGVGSPAIPDLLTKLKTRKASPTERKNGIRAMMFIHRESPPEAIRVLKEAANAATDPQEASQLESAARDAVAFCGEKWRVKCADEAAK
jgi:hypothetical protein